MSAIRTKGAAWSVLGTPALMLLLLLGAVSASPGTKPAKEPTAPPPAPEAPVIGNTRANLQEAFTNEMNAKERYMASARQADTEGYPEAAMVFRACARAEQVHADRDVQAIAWNREPAKAMLSRVALGTTAENLKWAIDRERYEAELLYPAWLKKAREEGQPMAVRSLNLALAAERQHVQLFTGVLERLGQAPHAHAMVVCPFCGFTAESIGVAKCPSCFTGAKRFIRVT